MCKKVKQLIKRCYESKYFWGKLFLAIWVIVICITCAKITIQKQWEEIFTYPEEKYQELENEANRIIDNNDFKTVYHCVINEYDNESNYLSFELSKDNAYLYAYVENYGTENQQKNLERMDRNNGRYILRYIICGGLILLAGISLIITAIIYFPLFGIIYGIMSIIEFIMSKIKK